MLRLLLSRLAAWPRADRVLLALALLALLAAPLRLFAPRPESREAGVSERGALQPEALSAMPAAPPHLAPEGITATVVAGPFRADRTAPPRRYRPGQPNDGERTPPEVTPPTRIPGYRLLGIATAGGIKLAVIDGAATMTGSRVYHVRDSLDAYRLIEIGGDSVVVSGEDTTFVLRILRPWKSPKQ